MKDLKGLQHVFLSIAAVILIGCNSAKTYHAKYEAAWEKVVQSDAWEESLREPNASNDLEEASIDEDGWLTENNTTAVFRDPFQTNYDSWVAQAYFKIIAEAEAADSRIKAEYERFIAENPDAAASSDENVVRILAMYKKKYKAHENMLEGLRSWHAFEDYGSDDLTFFKEEFENVVRAMYRRGQQEQHIVNFLVYKLADLYHLDADLPED